MLRPRFVTFDCYGTLSRPLFNDMAREIYADRLPGEGLDQFIRDFSAFRFDEVLGTWKPYRDVIVSAVERTCRKHAIRFDEAEAGRFYDAVPRWAPHPDVPPALKRVAQSYPSSV